MDIWTMPLCRDCHEAFTVDRISAEQEYGSQWKMVTLTLTQAIYDGVIKL